MTCKEYITQTLLICVLQVMTILPNILPDFKSIAILYNITLKNKNYQFLFDHPAHSNKKINAVTRNIRSIPEVNLLKCKKLLSSYGLVRLFSGIVQMCA